MTGGELSFERWASDGGELSNERPRSRYRELPIERRARSGTGAPESFHSRANLQVNSPKQR